MNNSINALERIEKSILGIAEREGISFKDVILRIEKKHKCSEASQIPLSIFSASPLSSLEAIVKYLKENTGLDYSQIALLLGRNYDPIAITYRNAKRKMQGKLGNDTNAGETVPLSIFRNRALSVLENLASYLKSATGRTYHEIAAVLELDDRTIWTVCHRAMLKQNRLRQNAG